MKLVSFRKNGEERLGLLINDSIVDVHRGYYQLYGIHAPSKMLAFLETGEKAMDQAKKLEKATQTNWDLLDSTPNIVFDVGSVELLAPIPRTRKNIICLGLNYQEHVEEVGSTLPSARAHTPRYPIFFTKPPTSIIGPDAPILLPKSTSKVDYEAELAFIFGRRAKNVSEDEAYNYIAGYTILNDVTARDLQRRHEQWFKGKGLDTFAPMGPYLITKDEVPNPHNLEITLELNDTLMQKSNTRNIIFKIPTLVKYITMDMTMEAGDVVATGTPSGVGYTRNPPVYLKSGDTVKITVEKVGILNNKIV